MKLSGLTSLTLLAASVVAYPGLLKRDGCGNPNVNILYEEFEYCTATALCSSYLGYGTITVTCKSTTALLVYLIGLATATAFATVTGTTATETDTISVCLLKWKMLF
jgi:hypothetical protein